MERWMIVYLLPLEVWMDIFCFPWISREEFGQIVARIGNFKFAEHAQFYLHEWGKRKLGELTIDKDGPYKYVDFKPYRLEYPQTPMPENVKSFDCIGISHFDVQTIDFLGKIRSLLSDVEVGVIVIPPIHLLDNFRTILTQLVPILKDGIRSLYCSNESVFSMAKEQLFGDNEKLDKLKWFESNVFTDDDTTEMVAFITNWFAQPDTDGPRLLELSSNNAFFMQIFKAVREQFIAATIPRTFAVNLRPYNMEEERHIAEFHLDNRTGEELHGKWTQVDGEPTFQITRHRVSWKTKETREWIEEMTKQRAYSRIWIQNPTIGPIDAQMQHMDEEQLEQQPCLSKDA